MKFVFDPRKSATNKRKHGIDFIAVQALWDDPFALEMPARIVGEARFIVIGMLGTKHWSVVVTYRDDDIRIISARRSREKEIVVYEKNYNH
jgi:uncharacterized DUF497 family protein